MNVFIVIGQGLFIVGVFLIVIGFSIELEKRIKIPDGKKVVFQDIQSYVTPLGGPGYVAERTDISFVAEGVKNED